MHRAVHAHSQPLRALPVSFAPRARFSQPYPARLATVCPVAPTCLDAFGQRTSLATPCTLPPGSQRRHLEKLHKLMAEWGFKDLATAEAYHRRTLRQRQGETRKKLEVGLGAGLGRGATVPPYQFHRLPAAHAAAHIACLGQPFAAAHADVKSAAADAVLGASNGRTYGSLGS